MLNLVGFFGLFFIKSVIWDDLWNFINNKYVLSYVMQFIYLIDSFYMVEYLRLPMIFSILTKTLWFQKDNVRE